MDGSGKDIALWYFREHPFKLKATVLRDLGLFVLVYLVVFRLVFNDTVLHRCRGGWVFLGAHTKVDLIVPPHYFELRLKLWVL